MSSNLQELVQKEVESLGYELVEFRVGGPRARPVLDVRIDTPTGEAIRVADCEAVSRRLEARLDAAPDVVSGRYVLEVSSPGIERPLRSLRDWRRFVGRRASVKSERFAAIGGHVEVQIVSVGDDEVVRVRDDKGMEHDLALADIERARLAVHWNT